MREEDKQLIDRIFEALVDYKKKHNRTPDQIAVSLDCLFRIKRLAASYGCQPANIDERGIPRVFDIPVLHNPNIHDFEVTLTVYKEVP